MPGYPQALCDLAPFNKQFLNRETGFPASRLLVERLLTVPTRGRLDSCDLEGLEQWIRAR